MNFQSKGNSRNYNFIVFRFLLKNKLMKQINKILEKELDKVMASIILLMTLFSLLNFSLSKTSVHVKKSTKTN